MSAMKLLSPAEVEINGRRLHTGILIAAALQDRPHTTGDMEVASGVHGGPTLSRCGPIRVAPDRDADTATAARYRAICRDLLALAIAARDATYDLYCGSAVTTRGGTVHSLGHGSWVTGPDGCLQAEWSRWSRLTDELSTAVN